MNKEEIKAVRVWGGWLRICHGLIALGIGFQIISAWLIAHANVDLDFWHDWHLMTGQGLLIAFLFRLYLFSQPGSGHWRALIPRLSGMKATAMFYLSLTRLPLPKWHAHNPLWKPIYIIMFVLLAISLMTGVLHGQPLAGVPIQSAHDTSAWLLGILSLGHIVATVLHDWKGRGSDISAMINGYRYFHLNPSTINRTIDENNIQTISLEGLKSKKE